MIGVVEQCPLPMRSTTRSSFTGFGTAAAQLSGEASASLICPDTDSVIVETVKQAEDGNGLVIRLYEHERTRGQVTLTADFGIQQAFLTNLLEEAEEELSTDGGQVSLPFTPYQIATLRLLPQKEEK